MQEHQNQTLEAKLSFEMKGNRRTTGLKVEEALLGSFSNMMSDNFGIEKPSLYPVID
jgi:hypothetical protein